MVTRILLLSGLLVSAVVAGVACEPIDGPTSPASKKAPRDQGAEDDTTDDSNNDGDDNGPDAGPADGSTGADGGADGGGDGGDAGDGGAVNVFAGRPAYTATLGPTTQKASHPNPAGQNCTSVSACHGVGAGAREFLFGGTVYTAKAGGAVAPQVEVLVLDATGKALNAYTDALGNFFRLKGNEVVTLPVRMGARDATNVRNMPGALQANFVSCNGCHQTNNGTGGIHVP